MQRITAFAGAALAGAVGALLLRRRRPAPVAPASQTAGEVDPRAAELRRQLAETRAAEESHAPASPERSVDEFEAMRRRIHAEGREAAERMKRSGEDT